MKSLGARTGLTHLLPANAPAGRVLFISGTDTGVGKTLLTALLLAHGRQSNRGVCAIKPFASGSRSDAALLDAMQDGQMPPRLLNPFFFRDPVAPLIAARAESRRVSPRLALERIGAARAACRFLLVEGCGGLLTPLGPGYAIPELVQSLGASLIIVGRNELGVIHQILCCTAVLRQRRITPAAVVLMGVQHPDSSSVTNESALRELAAPIPVLGLPYLGPRAATPVVVKKACKILKKSLARLWRLAHVEDQRRSRGGRTRRAKKVEESC